MKSRKIAVSLHRERKQKRFYFALKRIYSQAWHKIEAQRRYRFTPLGFAFLRATSAVLYKPILVRADATRYKDAVLAYGARENEVQECRTRRLLQPKSF